jgi:transcriptional regulator with XRE-family HTH domain
MQVQTGISLRRCKYSPERLWSPREPKTDAGEGSVPTRPGPTVQRRRLGIELRQLREQAGKTIEEVARVLECSTSKVSRLETGQVSASPRDVRDMLGFFGVDPERREALVEFARTARKKGWWEAYADTLLVPLVGLEVAADRILAYEPRAIHGLLQTPDYARALIHAVQPDLTEEQVQRRVELRMTRQELLLRANPPEFLLVLEECALRRPVGGRSSLRAQLQYLDEAMTAIPSLTLQILPLNVGGHAAIDGPFTVYQFSAPTDPDVVYFEHATANMYLESKEQVELYSTAFERILAEASGPSESSQFLLRLLEDL